MENYNQIGDQQVSASIQRFFFPSSMATVLPPNMGSFVPQAEYFQASSAAVKGEVVAPSPARFESFPLSAASTVGEDQEGDMEENHLAMGSASSSINNNNSTSSEVEAMKAKIMSHPHFSNLLHSYMECHQVGAPPEVAARMAATWQEFEASRQRSNSVAPKDPELDQFMEAYSDMLRKYKEELTRPVQEAMDFMRRIESQLNVLTNGHLRVFPCDERLEGAGSSDEEQEINSGGETEVPEIGPRAEDRELKNHLLKKYSGYLSSLKQELSKKKKVRKLPKEARQKLLTWWELHYKWPYPSESEKAALSAATGLDQKQINNWFINQRKRHWKPSEDMQFMVMEGIHPHNVPPALYMEGHHFMGDGPYRFGT